MEAAKAQRCQIRPARSEADLEQLEAAYRILDLYIWLSFRLEDAFTGVHVRVHIIGWAAGPQIVLTGMARSASSCRPGS